jgi:nucleoside phosphorylase
MLKVLVITALQEELDAVLRLKENRNEDWVQRKTPQGYIYYEAIFQDEKSSAFQLIASSQPKMGKVACASHTTRMLQVSSPDFAFMTGICAGRRNKGVELGDIIVGVNAFDVEVGKKVGDDFHPEISGGFTNQTIVSWLNDFDSKKIELRKLINIPRPVSLRFQKEWILLQLSEKAGWPSNENHRSEIKLFCPNWIQAIDSLFCDSLVNKSPSLNLTDLGESKASQLKLENLSSNPAPDRETPRVRIGSFATGSSVIEINNYFEELTKKRDRKILAVDMEASAFHETVKSHLENLPCVIIKGVCDFADETKDDSFHEYAAHASAVWMLEFSKYALPLITEKTVTDHGQNVMYPITLPRPAKTLEDRKRWKALLQWSAFTDELGDDEFFEQKLQENNFSGMEFYNLDSQQFLLEVEICLHAYQASYIYVYLDERGANPKWNIINFREIYSISSQSNELCETIKQRVCGSPYFDVKTNTLVNFYKSRGIGDCGSISTYKIEDGTATLIELRIKNCSNYESFSQDELIPDQNIETAENNIEDILEPEEWPLIDITQNYPASTLQE